MKKVLLALTVLTLAAGALPAQATVSTYIRTIVTPTTFGGTNGVFSLPSIINNPTDPDEWSKQGVVGRNARCAYLKAPSTAQDASTGQLGYVFQLPAAFGNGDRFTLVSHSTNPAQYDFDVFFYTTLGACLADVEVTLPLNQGTATVPLEGAGPTPDADSPQCVQDKQAWTTLFNDGGVVGSSLAGCAFDANYAIVVMPIGANGKFSLQLTY